MFRLNVAFRSAKGRSFAEQTATLLRRLQNLHADERGALSLLSLFAVLMMTMLLVYISNTAVHLIDKVRRQNAADAAAYSGGVVLARGMNAIAFANQLEADVLALTAMSQALVELRTSNSSAAATALPVLLTILGTSETTNPQAKDHLLPLFQQEVLTRSPELAQEAMLEAAMRHGLTRKERLALAQTARSTPEWGGQRGPQTGALWRTTGQIVNGNENNPQTRSLPVIDPSPQGADAAQVSSNSQSLLMQAQAERSQHAGQYLQDWLNQIDPNNSIMGMAVRKRAQAKLTALLTVQYPHVNLPFLLTEQPTGAASHDILERDYNFVGVCYRQRLKTNGGRIFQNPAAGDPVSYAAVRLFLPRPRYVCCPWTSVENWPTNWSTWNQNWTVQLCPATSQNLGQILQQTPPFPPPNFQPPPTGSTDPRDQQTLNTH